MEGCILLPFDTAAGLCRACGDKVGARRTWCGPECRVMYERNHYWQVARIAAIKRDNNECTRCGFRPDHWDIWVRTGQLVFWTRANLLKKPPTNWLEVNHITPRLGQGYGTGCWHHLVGLETLCHTCHVKVTNRQRIDRARRRG